jgi:hypothetical protein
MNGEEEEKELLDIFLKLIQGYNARKEHFHHYVKLSDTAIMIISWTNQWQYRIEKLEHFSEVSK